MYNKVFFTKTGRRLDVTHGEEFTEPWSCPYSDFWEENCWLHREFIRLVQATSGWSPDIYFILLLLILISLSKELFTSISLIDKICIFPVPSTVTYIIRIGLLMVFMKLIWLVNNVLIVLTEVQWLHLSLETSRHLVPWLLICLSSRFFALQDCKTKSLKSKIHSSCIN